MGESSRKHLSQWWIAAVCAAALLAPSLAQAERHRVRRSLPAGAVAQTTPPAESTASGTHPAILAGVDRLRRSFEATGGQAANGASLFQTPGGHIRSLSAPAGQVWTASSFPGADRDPGGAALAFLRDNRVALGWSKRGASLLARSIRKSRGRSFVRFEQRFQDLRVFGAGAVVQVEPSGGVSFVLADLARDDAALHDPAFSIVPEIDSSRGVAAALDLTRSVRSTADVAADPGELMVFEPSVIGSAGPSRLVWNVRVRNGAGDVNEVVLVDAVSGEVAFHYSDVKEAKSRSIYDHNNVRGSAGTLVRTEGSGASAIADADLAYQYFGDTYDFYFSRFGRDSYNGAGAALVGRVRYCETTGSCPYSNAYWNGSEMRFGDGYAAADDVVGHELTHAVTEAESNLIYWGESGAINEALSDIFGELIDLSNSGGIDTAGVRWQMGEDAPGGAIRSMSDPPAYGDPDRRFSSLWYTGAEDNRGVHFNSGVANKLAFLLTDGGSFNGQTVTALGLTQVARLFYEAQVNLLVPASDYYDLDAALVQAAKNLGWSAAALDSLQRGRAAVEITQPTNPTTLFQDGFEGSFPGSWQVSVSDLIGEPTRPPPPGGVPRSAVPPAAVATASTARRAGPDRRPDTNYTTLHGRLGRVRPLLAVPGPGGVGRVRPLSRRRVRVGRRLLGRVRQWVGLRGLRGIAGPRRPDAGMGPRAVQLQGDPARPERARRTAGVVRVQLSVRRYPVEYEGAYVDNFVLQKSTISRPQSVWHPFFAVNTLETPYVGDFDGDGKSDIITFTRQNPSAVGDVYVALSDGTKFGANTKWNDWFAITTDETVVIGDYDGDGKDDIATWLGKSSRQVYVARSLGNGMTGATVWLNTIGFDSSDVPLSGDANGDGKDDLILFARKQGKVYVALSDGTEFGTPTQWHSFFAVSTYERPRVADVNGDGKADIVTFATDSPTAFGDVYVATSRRGEVPGPQRGSELVVEVARLVRDPARRGSSDRGPRRRRQGRLLHLPAPALRPVLHRALAGPEHGTERAVEGGRESSVHRHLPRG